MLNNRKDINDHKDTSVEVWSCVCLAGVMQADRLSAGAVGVDVFGEIICVFGSAKTAHGDWRTLRPLFAPVQAVLPNVCEHFQPKWCSKTCYPKQPKSSG